MVFEQTDGRVHSSRIYAVSARAVPNTLVTVGGPRGVYSTPDHLFYVHGTGWVAAGELLTSDLIVSRTAISEIWSEREVGRVRKMPDFANVSSSIFINAVHPTSAEGPIMFARNMRNSSTEVIVYNIYAEDTHTFFVGEQDMLVHSCVGMNIPLDSAFERSRRELTVTASSSAGLSHGSGLFGSGATTSGVNETRQGITAKFFEILKSVMVLDAFSPALVCFV